MIRLFSKIPDALVRVIVVIALLCSIVLLIRLVLPRNLTDTAVHVQSTMDREMQKPVMYAGQGACTGCHEESAKKASGYHKNLSCETCHGMARQHVDSPLEIKPVIPSRREFCYGCHRYDRARATGFPQINPAVHNPLKECISCHDPHDPKPPTVPQECAACHGEIARSKAISPHVQLECTTCHTVPAEHKISPRAARAEVPTEREFCGRCHAKGASPKDPPKVDLATHGEKYLCWQCHYPHLPELD
jgi:hypothetical protein